MKKFTAYLFLIYFFLSSIACTKINKESIGSASDTGHDTVYIGLTGDLGIYVEDHVTPKLFTDFFGWDTATGEGYEKYVNYCREVAQKYTRTMEKTNKFVFDDYEKEFEKLTNLKIGDKLFVSFSGGVFPGEVYKYVFDFEDEIGAGNIFYPVLNIPTNQIIPSNEIVVVSGYSNMSAIDRTGEKDRAVVDHFKDILLPMLKDVVAMDYIDDKEIKNKVTSIDDEEIKVFKGDFTGSNKDEYAVCYWKQLSFDKFASAIFIMNYEGEILNKHFKLREGDFQYVRVAGIVDYNGDGIYELIIEDGYYEGGGTGLYELIDNDYKMIAYGFYFGV